ncbi:unnamed protein product [marine sediment metagenome]|uniref:Uncharacterized protein n=1 Tax=marine sediment metagenome TaxID=412755 RepID=X0XCY0_9ZZZZ
MKINKGLYIASLFILAIQFYYLIYNNFTSTQYFTISSFTILYGGLLALSLIFVKEKEGEQ